MWIVVVFQNDNSVAAVPTNWYKDGFCAWPKKCIKHKGTMIQNQTEPTRSEFDRFQARKLSSSPIESLQEAMEKASKGRISSDLSSAEEYTNENFNRKKKLSKDVFTPKEKYQSQPSKKKRSLSPAPMFEESLDNEHDTTSNDLLWAQQKHVSTLTSTSKNQILNICEDNVINSQINTQSSSPKTSPFLTKTADICDDNLTLVTDFDELLFQSTPKSDVLVQLQHSNTNNDAAADSPDNHEFVSFVKSSLINLKYDVKLLSYSIDSLKTIIQTIEMNTSHIPSNSVQQNIIDIQELKWPISNTTQLDEIEQLLMDTNIKNNEVRMLARLVGKSISESVRRMMSRMCEDSFLQNYSFLGFKGKSKFYGLSCCQLLFDAIREEKKFSTTPDHEISTVVAKWLAQAPNRISKKKSNPSANN